MEKKTQDILNQLALKVAKDQSFRKKLLSNAKKAIEEEFHIQLAEDVEIEVLQDSAHKVHLVLPPDNLKDFSEKELQEIIGGAGQNFDPVRDGQPVPLFWGVASLMAYGWKKIFKTG